MKTAKYIIGIGLVCLLTSACKKTEKVLAEEAAAEAAVATMETNEAGQVIVLKPGEKLAPVSNMPIIIDFNATWCGPCRKFAPIFEAAAEKYAGKALFYSVDVDQHPELARMFGVQSIPQVSYISISGNVTSDIGLMPADTFDARVASVVK